MAKRDAPTALELRAHGTTAWPDPMGIGQRRQDGTADEPMAPPWATATRPLRAHVMVQTQGTATSQRRTTPPPPATPPHPARATAQAPLTATSANPSPDTQLRRLRHPTR